MLGARIIGAIGPPNPQGGVAPKSWGAEQKKLEFLASNES